MRKLNLIQVENEVNRNDCTLGNSSDDDPERQRLAATVMDSAMRRTDVILMIQFTSKSLQKKAKFIGMNGGDEELAVVAGVSSHEAFQAFEPEASRKI